MTKKSQNNRSQERKRKTTNLDRSFTFDRSAVNEEERTVDLAFSSEEPYERWYGTEILAHKSQSVDLARLNNGAAVLVNHNVDDHVGVVEGARIDKDHVGRAVVRFSRSDRGQEIFSDIVDGIRGMVSVGYTIEDYTEKEVDGKNVLTANSWTPHEVSIVAVPADASVGIGRSDEPGTSPDTIIEATKMTEETKPKEAAAQPEPKFDRKEELGKMRESETKRCKQIRSMADAHDADELGRQAIDEGWEYAAFNKQLLEVVGQRNTKARAESRSDGNVGLSGKEADSFSFVKLMNAVSQPQDRAAQKAAAFELEVSEAGAKQFGSDFKARGTYIPQEILERGHAMQERVLNVTTATDGPELVATDLLAGSFIDVLRNSQVTAQAGVRTLPGLVGLVDIPRQTTASTMTWLSAEDDDATVSEPQFDQVSLSPKDAAVYTETTRRLTMQSTPAIEGIIRSDLAQAIGIGTDAAILYGTGATGQPKGVAAQTGINTFNLAAADPTYEETVRMIKETMVDNALIGNLAYLIDPNGWEHLITTEKFDTTGRTILEGGMMNGYRTLVSNQVTAEDYFFGNWSDVLVGEWGGLELNTDPYTHSLKGRIRFIIFKTMDVAVRHPESFCHCNDAA